jgi:uncharacterized DUF497 family protein
MPEWDEAKRTGNRRKHGIDFTEESSSIGIRRW